jgi:type VI secretion system secreted protein VgrG
MALTQANRPMRIDTSLGADKLLVTRCRGVEAISQLFQFELELIAETATDVPFDKLLGQPICITLEQPDGKRYIHGMCKRVSAGRQDQEFAHYRMEIVPKFWLLTRTKRSRIFQQKSVTDILKEVLTGIDVKFDLKGTFEPRDYCVQYRESDFDFASRLMEEEGIYYYFAHTDGGHKLTLANTPNGHPNVPISVKAIYDEVQGGIRDDLRVIRWEKTQEIRSGKVTLWDHCFELPHQHLDANKELMAGTQVGKISHKLQLAGVTDKLELYDYPGAYAQRFDGVEPGGGDRAADLEKIFQDNARTVEIRLQEEQARALRIIGASKCLHFTAGHKFTLERHFNADGDYVLLRIEHDMTLAADYRSGSGDRLVYENSFECAPLAVPFRPARTTAKPTVRGTQTAVVVGPPGEEIFTDKYSRIKVQFHWDRDGKNDADSSCWIRVATPWAGKQWGMIHIPRIGQEVVVDFLEGDPDQPLVIGSVYNADQMPPYALPENKTQSGIQTRSSTGGGAANHNQIRFEDKAGAEQLHIHAEKNQDIEVENDETHWVGHDRKKTIDHDETTHVKHDRTETVDNNETITVHANRTETVDVNESITVGGNRTRSVGGNESVTVSMMRTHTVGINEAITVGAAQEVTIGGLQAITVGAARSVTVGGSQSETIGGSLTTSIAKNQALTIGGAESHAIAKSRSVDVGENDTLKIKKKLIIDAGDEITIKTGDAQISMKKDGSILIKGKDIVIQGSGKITAKASKDLTLKGSKIGAN